MSFKMTFQYIKQNFKSYWIYFFTLAFGISIFYIFNSIPTQQSLLDIDRTMHHALLPLQEMINCLALIIALMMGTVIVYVNNSLLKRRKKELAVYMLLGMEPHLIFVKLMYETIGFTISALISGLIFGVFGSQFVPILTAKIYSVNFLDFHFIFSSDAFVKSLACSSSIFFVILLSNYFSIKKCRLINLLQDEQSYEKVSLSNNKGNIIYFWMILGSLLISAGILLNHSLYIIKIGFVAVLIIIVTSLIVLSLSKIIVWILTKKQFLILKGLRSFFLNECYFHLRSSLLSVTIVTLFLTAAIGIFFWGYTMQNALSEDLRCPTPYDFSVHQYGKNDAESLAQSLPESILSNGKIKDFAEINVHFTNKVFGDNLAGSMNDKDLDNIPIIVVGVSDYNQSMRLAGLPYLSLSPNRYALATGLDSLHNMGKFLIEKNISYSLGEKRLYPEPNIKTWPISDNISSIYMIVPDSIVNDYPIKERILNIQCESPLAMTQIKAEIENYQQFFYNSIASYQEKAFYYFDKTEIYESTTLAKVVSTILIIYLDLIIMIFCGAILAFHQLTGIKDHRNHYQVLLWLGVPKKLVNKIIFFQLLFLFLIPLGLAMLYSSCILILMREYLAIYTMDVLFQGICVTLGYVVIFYIGYAVLTYLNCKKVLKFYM
ncbi:MAG: FtsX-like permease family protein [Peptococcaceae bacterium]|nr:FtsX-like permease family protein [Peptococcaceae bacterium]